MAGISGCFKSKNGDSVVMASEPSDVMVHHDPSETNDECSGKKKSKFKNFKKFFARKKRKEPASHGVESELSASKSSDNVSKSSGNTLSRSDKEKGSKVSLGSKALSHDSVFASDLSEANEALGASQDSIHGKVKSLQLQLKQAIRLGSPPSLMCVKRTEDAGTMSEDDGLPCSPPEYSSPHATQVQRDSLTSLDSEDEQRSSRVGSPLLVIPADFSQPASPFACLDNSAAKHKLGLRQKACNKRKPANRPEVKAETVENHVVPFPECLDEQDSEKTPGTCDDEHQPNMEKEEMEEEEEEEDEEEEEEEEEKPQHSMLSLSGDEEEEEREHKSEISHSPDTSGLPESDLSGEAADLQSLSSSRSSTPDSPRASTASPADQKVDVLDSAQTEESWMERTLSVEEDDRGTPEESTFLEEVLNSLKTALVTESAELKDEENVKKEVKVEDATDAATEMTGDEEEDTEELKEHEEEVKEEEVFTEAGEEREADEEEEVVKSKEEEPDMYQDVPCGSPRSSQSSEEKEEDVTQSTTVPHKLDDEEELSEDDDDDEPEVELFIPYGHEDEVCTEEAEEAALFQTKPGVEEAGADSSDDEEDTEMKVDEQEDSMEEQEITEVGQAEQKLDMGEELEDDEWKKKDEEQQLLEWERRMLDVTHKVVDNERDEGTDEQDEMLVEPFPDKEETCGVLPEHQEDRDAYLVVSDETFSTQRGAHEEETPAELDEQIQQQEVEEEVNDEEGEEEREQRLELEETEEQKTVDVVSMQEKEIIQNSFLDPESQPEAQPEDLSSSSVLSPDTATTTVHTPNSEKVPCLPAECEDPVSSPAAPEEQCFKATEEKSPIKEEMIEEEKCEEQLCEEQLCEQAINRTSSGPDQRKVRFTIATAWQRSLSSEDGGEASSAPPASNITPESTAASQPATVEDSAQTSPVEPEKVVLASSPERVESTESIFSKVQKKTSQELSQASEDSSARAHGCPDNPFGVKLRKTSGLSRLSQEEEVPAESHDSKVESPQTVSEKPLIQPITKKPALPKKPDGHGDSGVKTRHSSEPAPVCSGVSGGPSWISVAKQKQKIYKDHSLNEISIKKEHDRKSSLPTYNSSVGEHRLHTPEQVAPSDLSKSSSLSEKEGRWIMSSPTPVPPVSSKSIPAPPPGPKPQVSPAALKVAPQPSAPPHRGLSPALSKHTHPLSPTPAVPACASRTSPGQTGSRGPALTGHTPQRSIPPPASPQNEPPWMALAKKKAKAWSEMPQIVQ